MSAGEASASAGPPDRRPAAIERLTAAVAATGGALAIGVALLVSSSVLSRWLFSAPIEGDFEFVKMATAIAVFAYLPYTQARRGNVMVDTFTSWLPGRVRNLMDAFWDLVFAGVMATCAVGLAEGALEAMKSGETTMQLMLIVWPVIALCAVLCALIAATALLTAFRMMRAHR